MRKIHILPLNDLKDHKESEFCDCDPEVEVQHNGDVLYIHNSFDGREAVEMANDVLKHTGGDSACSDFSIDDLT